MNYSEVINYAFVGSSSAHEVKLHKSTIEQALGEKQKAIGALSSNGGPFFSDQDVLLFENRILGSAMTRLALGIAALKETGTFKKSLYDESADIQDEIRSELYDEVAGKWHGIAADEMSDEATVTRLDSLYSIPHSFVREQLASSKRAELTRLDRFQRIASYVNFLPGTFPPGHLKDFTVATNDSVLVQAFGRNSIPDKRLPEVFEQKRQLENDEAVFQYLDDQQFDAGKSNRALAEVVRDELLSGKVVEPIIQWEVAYALREIAPDVYSAYSHYLHSLWPTKDFYPTFEVKSDSVEIMDQLGIYNPKELAHKDMMIRALGILSELDVEADILAADIPFDKHSVQSQVRGPLRWALREALARGEHVLNGRVKF